jgi:protein phosphatase 2C family protein 2/3
MDERGCTANVVLIVPDDPATNTPATIYCANAGDSRCIVSVNHKSLALSIDHKPTNPTERSRI